MRLNNNSISSGVVIQQAIDDAALSFDSLQETETVDKEDDKLLIYQNEENKKIFLNHLLPRHALGLPPEGFDAARKDRYVSSDPNQIKASEHLGENIIFNCGNEKSMHYIQIDFSDLEGQPVYLRFGCMMYDTSTAFYAKGTRILFEMDLAEDNSYFSWFMEGWYHIKNGYPYKL